MSDVQISCVSRLEQISWECVRGISRRRKLILLHMLMWSHPVISWCVRSTTFPHSAGSKILVVAEGFWADRLQSRCFGVHISTWSVWCQCFCVTNYVDQWIMKLGDDYVLPHQRLWTFDVLVCPLTATERFLLQPERHCCPPLSPSSAVVLNHIFSHFFYPLSDSCVICTVPAQWLVILYASVFILFLWRAPKTCILKRSPFKVIYGRWFYIQIESAYATSC